MDLRYKYNDQRIAEGERSVVYTGGQLYVRTGMLEAIDGKVTYRLREVYDASAQNVPEPEPQPENNAPVLEEGHILFKVPPGSVT